ncbi:BET1-like protein [Neocloeon triangulifer]|uniref:BET1-like protein n=1 Tax=Neocloeon triangulifer TaxID=2078957 RepID=UPI00286ED92F|nr:BET1-like protein [Neocloeon triangulifer]
MAAVYNIEDQDEDTLDRQNRVLTENLSGKVSRLKSLAFDIETEAKEHHGLLDGLSMDFESGTGLLSGSMNRVHKMMNSGRNNRKAMFYVAGLVVTVFVVIYFGSSALFNAPE